MSETIVYLGMVWLHAFLIRECICINFLLQGWLGKFTKPNMQIEH